MSQLSVDMAITILQTKLKFDKNLDDQVCKVYRYGYIVLRKDYLKEQKEYPNGWLLRFVDFDSNSLLVLVRDDDRIYIFGISALAELNIVGDEPRGTEVLTVEEKYLGAQGDTPRLYGSDPKSLSSGR